MVKREREEEGDEIDFEKRVKELQELCKTKPKLKRVQNQRNHALNKLKWLHNFFPLDILIQCSDKNLRSNKAIWDKIHYGKEGFAEPKYESPFKASTMEAIFDDFFEETNEPMRDCFDLVEYAKAIDYYGINEESVFFLWEEYVVHFGRNKEKIAVVCNCDHPGLAYETIEWVVKNYSFSTVVELLPYLNKEALEKLFVIRESVPAIPMTQPR